MKSVQLGARIALTALPLGIVRSLAVRSLDASRYGISVLPVAVFFIFRGLVTREGLSRKTLGQASPHAPTILAFG